MPPASRPHPNGISRYAGRSTRRYKADRKTFRRDCRNANAPCWLCGKPIDYDLPHDHPDSWSLDHAYTVEDHPELAEDPANYRASHLDCNKKRGKGEPHIYLGSPSEDW